MGQSCDSWNCDIFKCHLKRRRPLPTLKTPLWSRRLAEPPTPQQSLPRRRERRKRARENFRRWTPLSPPQFLCTRVFWPLFVVISFEPSRMTLQFLILNLPSSWQEITLEFRGDPMHNWIIHPKSPPQTPSTKTEEGKREKVEGPSITSRDKTCTI